MQWTRAKILAAAAGGVAVAGGVTAAILSTTGANVPGPAASHTSPVNQTLTSPFTGEPVRSLGPVLAVKIDNIVFARPQTGLTHADIVYVIPVEGGLSRFLAIFSSHIPRVIGPVRSAREDDLELLRQFGRPAFAFSGAQPQLLPVVEHARIANLYAGVAGGYYRNYSRIAPYNLFARTKTLLAEARRASKAHGIGFVFGAPPPGGRRVASEAVRYSAASFTFTWSAARGRWLVEMDGRRAGSTEGPQLSAATVVIQHTTVRTSRFLERGQRPPYAETTGAGIATILRSGEAYQARWSRPRADGGTSFTTGTGQPMAFAQGPVWIVLVPR